MPPLEKGCKPMAYPLNHRSLAVRRREQLPAVPLRDSVGTYEAVKGCPTAYRGVAPCPLTANLVFHDTLSIRKYIKCKGDKDAKKIFNENIRNGTCGIDHADKCSLNSESRRNSKYDSRSH